MPTELDPLLSIREILMRITLHSDLDTKGAELTNVEVDNNFIILYEAFKSIYSGVGVSSYDNGKTYDEDEVVVQAGIVYLSLQDSNVGNTPGVGGSELFWGLCSIGDLINIVFTDSTKSGISAAGTIQGDATKLRQKINRVDTVASGAGVVNRDAELIGFKRTVQNYGANDLLWYPFLGSNFLGQAVNLPITITSGNQASVICYDNGILTLI